MSRLDLWSRQSRLIQSSVAYATALLITVTLHEFGHGTAAWLYGFHPMVYGLHEEDIAASQVRVAVIAAAGPLVSLVLGMVFLAIQKRMRGQGFPRYLMLWLGLLGIAVFVGYLITPPFYRKRRCLQSSCKLQSRLTDISWNIRIVWCHRHRSAWPHRLAAACRFSQFAATAQAANDGVGNSVVGTGQHPGIGRDASAVSLDAGGNRRFRSLDQFVRFAAKSTRTLRRAGCRTKDLDRWNCVAGADGGAGTHGLATGRPPLGPLPFEPACSPLGFRFCPLRHLVQEAQTPTTFWRASLLQPSSRDKVLQRRISSIRLDSFHQR